MTFYIIVVVVMAAATIIEKYEGTSFVSSNIYGAWWFSLLWALLAAFGIFYFLKRRVRRLSTVVLHASFLFILLGALLTHLTSYQGSIHLRQGEPVDLCMDRHQLPFSLTLKQFNISYHEGTRAEADYESVFSIGQRSKVEGQRDEVEGQRDEGEEYRVSMNNIASYRGYRFYQSGFDPDMMGTYLAVNSDPWGIPITYTGYALLFLALVWMLFDPKGSYRQLLRKISLTVIILPLAATPAGAQKVLPRETADRFANLMVVYNDRVCPMETYALDFTKKLYGKRSYKDFTATQVLTGFIFYFDDWCNEPVIKVKGGELQERLHLPAYASVNQFFNQNGYVLGPYAGQYYQGVQEDFYKQAAKTDEKLMLIMELREGTPLKLFPYTQNATTTWYSPTDKLPETMDSEHQKYMREVFTLLNGEVQTGKWAKANAYLDKMQQYQQSFGGRSFPSPTKLKAERLYNRVPFATILFMVCLTFGFLSFIKWRYIRIASVVVLTASFLALTLCLTLRWIIVDHVPMSNGYETMLVLAWFLQLLTFVAMRRFPIMLTFGLLMSGFFLLVSHISLMDPQMSHMMPVLQSPLLSLHVSIIMMAYALLSLTFICGLTGIIIRKQAEQLVLLSQVFLYPALTTLGIGIFLGAIWANISWGTYWSWDPKEVWALITFMIYAIPAHTQTLPALRRPQVFHIFMTLAFLTILMTYFGVNYFLGGMHSYA